MPPTLELAPPQVEVEERDDGTTLVRSPVPLEPFARCVTVWLRRWSRERPDTTFLSERGADGAVERVSYQLAWNMVVSTAGGLLDRGASPLRPLMILSDNSIDHAILSLAAQHVGIPAVPVSPAYSLNSRDHRKLRTIFELVRPGVLFVDDAAAFEPALRALDVERSDTVVLASRNPTSAALQVRALAETTLDERAARAHAEVTPDTVAKVLFTSGSTGEPKGVLNTHRMLTSNQQMIAQCWPFLEHRPPVLVDWLPWNHTFGGNHNFNLVLRNGGTLHINHGKPVPALVSETVANLRAVSPTLYFDVPRGFAVLLPFLEEDREFAEHFFRSLDLVFYAGAALPQSLWDRLAALSTAVRGAPIRFVSAWGSTETAPLVTSVHFPIERAGV